MNYWGHAITSNIAVALLAVMAISLDKPWVSGLTYLVFLDGFSYADNDLKLDAHRSWYFHSALPAIILLGLSFWTPRELVGAAMFCISHGTHLLFDVKINKKGKRGTYLLYLFKGKRARVEQTDAWFLLNAIICICVAVSIVAWGNV